MRYQAEWRAFINHSIMEQKISKEQFFSRYSKRTEIFRYEIFQGRKALMEEIYATGDPIYCDQSYYAHFDTLDLVVRDDEGHFRCGPYKKFENWRDCHYYRAYEDEAGNRAWIITGGRYD